MCWWYFDSGTQLCFKWSVCRSMLLSVHLTSCSCSLPLSRVNNCPDQKFSSLVQINSCFIHIVHLSKGCAVTLNSRSDVNVKADFFWNPFLEHIFSPLIQSCSYFTKHSACSFCWQWPWNYVKVITSLWNLLVQTIIFLSLWSNTCTIKRVSWDGHNFNNVKLIMIIKIINIVNMDCVHS